MQTAYFAGGCFWCTEAVFQRIPGVVSVVSGYTGGALENPTYEDICTGKSGHAEAVKIDFDENQTGFETLLDIFFQTHDPTTLNRQGNDKGEQYRSAIFFVNKNQQQKALEKIQTLGAGVVTEIKPLGVFYPAEDYHQNYFNANQNQAYCRFVIAPKLLKYFGDE